MLRKLPFVLVFILCSLTNSWGGNDFQYRHIGMEDGLTSNTVRHITQDKYGYMWFGTDNGLCRYDGIKVQPYRIAENKSNQ